MLFVLFGTPSIEFAACVDIAAAALTVLAGPMDRFAVNSRSDLQQAWRRRAHPAVLVTSEAPDASLVALLRSASAPIFVILSEPVETAASLVRDRDMEPRLAIRTASLCFASLEPVLVDPDFATAGIAVGRATTVGELMEALLPFLGIEAEGERLERLERQMATLDADWRALAVRDAARRHPGWRSVGSALSEPERRLAAEALHAYRALAARRPVDEARWPLPLLMRLDEPDEPATGEIDLTGQARTIVYGPYMGLPAGLWRVEVALSVRDNGSGNMLLAQVSCLVIHAELRVPLPADGDLSLALDIAIADPKCPTELRLSIDEGAIEGILMLRDVSVRRLPRAGREMP